MKLKIRKYNYSGDDIIKKNLQNIGLRKIILKNLNKKDCEIFIKGMSGIIRIIKKKIFIIMTNKKTGVFFDISILLNILFLCL